MEKKPERSGTGCLCGITGFILLQCLTFVFVNLWQEWRLDSLRSRISEKEELLTLLETDCDFNHRQIPHDNTRIRRQGPTLTDFFKDFLSVQEKALETICTRRHDLCIPGPKGAKGDLGTRGPSGGPGQAGIPGQKGDQGPVGLRGVKGDPGSKGVKGSAGVTGSQGLRGPKGVQGETGTSGPKGDHGPRGNNGTDGLTGDIGVRGVKGQSGPKGAHGDPGAKGEAGLRGLPGQKGESGIRGLDGKLLHSECFCLNDFKMEGNFSSVVNVPYGAPFSLHCQVNMMNIPVTWTKDGGSISSRANFTGSDLDFLQVLKTDGGTYRCSGPDGILGYVTKEVKVIVGPSSVYDCDFESQCSWTQATDDMLDWTRHTGRTPTANTGPSHDHTLDGAPGHYMYLETSAATSGEAILQSEPLSAHHQFCLTFWYHMYGATIGTLEVRLKGPGRRGNPLWAKTGDQGNQWFMAKVNLPPQTNSYYVILDAIKGLSYTGDIAIDDIIFLDGTCP